MDAAMVTQLLRRIENLLTNPEVILLLSELLLTSEPASRCFATRRLVLLRSFRPD